MRKVFLQLQVSLDGYIAGPNRDLSWIARSMNEDLMAYIVGSLQGMDTQLIGRVTYQEQEGYWPSSTEPLAPLMNDSAKIVFSSTLDRTDWNNSRLAKGDPAEEIARLKEEPGGDIYVPGGASLVHALSAQRLIDEYRLLIHPTVVGGGLPLFKDPIDLKLESSQEFATGVVVNVYHPA
ncbi:MAG TPA: dihydrofolate reductase family protein [Streptosporangiaceae bacterium]